MQPPDKKQHSPLAGDLNSGKIEWWRGAIFYQIYPASFKDSNGDGIGDLPGITSALDHVASLGVDGIWLSPFFKSPLADFGYDISDFCDVDPVFGSMDDFDGLIEKAHDLKLKVIIDQVYSHSSDQHPWFQESRQSRTNEKSDWYVWADAKVDGTPPNNWQSVFGMGAWEWDARRGQYYFHNFLRQQPDLNLHNKDVQDAILDVTRFWLERGVDGFRLDALNFGMHDTHLKDNPVETNFKYPPTRPFDFQRHTDNMSQPAMLTFVKRIRKFIDQYPDRFTVAEIAGPFPLSQMKDYTKDETHLNTAYGFDFLYANSLTAQLVKSSIADWPGAKGEGWPSWAFSNHDAPRVVSRWRGECDREHYARLIALLLMSLRGNIFLYQGEELGLPQAEISFEDLKDPEAIANWPETLGRDGARTPIPWKFEGAYAGFSTVKPWLPIDPRHRSLSIETQNTAQDSLLQFYRHIIALRQASPALRMGSIEILDSHPDLLIFKRNFDGEIRTCVFNLTDKPLDLSLAIPKPALHVGGCEPGTSKISPYSGFISIPSKNS